MALATCLVADQSASIIRQNMAKIKLLTVAGPLLCHTVSGVSVISSSLWNLREPADSTSKQLQYRARARKPIPLLPIRRRPLPVLSPSQRRLPPPIRVKSLRNSNGVIPSPSSIIVADAKSSARAIWTWSASASKALLTSSFNALTNGL